MHRAPIGPTRRPLHARRTSAIAILTAVMLAALLASPVRAQSARSAATRTQLALADTITRITDRESGEVSQAMSSLFGAPAQGEAGARMGAVMRKFFDRYLPADTLRAIAVEDLVATYTEQELAQLLQFYRSDVGRKMLKQSPATMARMQQRMSRIMTEHRDELMQWMMEGVGER